MTEYVVPFIASFILTAICGRVVLPMLTRLHASQTEREEGPASHKKKNGTPTMGGIIFLVPWIIVTSFYIPTHRNMIPIFTAVVCFALIGFCDDYLKVIRHNNLGLRAWQKLLLQLVSSVIVLVVVRYFTNISFDMKIPFSSFFTAGGTAFLVTLGWIAVPVEMIVICGTVNGANFTDGLDGLASSVTAVIALFVTVSSAVNNGGIAPASTAFLGALLGFLLYNHHPARVFMGDTGSLALGGFVAASFIMMNMPVYILIAAFIYFAEVLSVIIQVLYFRATGGKRFFKMAPLHHHFELSGWSETGVVALFTLVTLVLSIIAFVAI